MLGTIVGGAFRLAPELMKIFDKKNERRHELAMLDKQLEHDAMRAKFAMQQLETAGQMVLDAAGMGALVESIKAQGRPTGIKWVDALSASVRPVLTYWWAIVLYTAVLIARFIMLTDSGIGAAQSLTILWGPDEVSIVSSIFMFWFLDRVIKLRPRS